MRTVFDVDGTGIYKKICKLRRDPDNGFASLAATGNIIAALWFATSADNKKYSWKK